MKLHKTLTISRTKTYGGQDAKHNAPYVDFPLVTGKNSAFTGLKAEQLDQLNSAEYLALRLVLWVVGLVSKHGYYDDTFQLNSPKYYLVFQAIGIAVFSSYLLQARWGDIFASQWRYVRPEW